MVHLITDLDIGGAETMLFKLLAHRDSARFEMSVASLMDGGPLARDIEALGVPVRGFGLRRGGWPSPLVLYRLVRYLRESRADVVQGWMYHGNFAAWLARRFSGGKVPLVWNIRQCLDDLSCEKFTTAAAIRFCARRSAGVQRILYNSEAARRQHENAGYCAGVGEVIANGFDLQLFCPDPGAGMRLRAELGLSSDSADTILVGLVARFDPMKDHANFLAAAAQLALRRPEARFVLAGRGLEKGNKEISRLIAEGGLEKRVFLLGERSDVTTLTAGLDIAVSSSRSEAFSNAIGEAMCCAVPCVVTDVGDSASLVGETGRVVPSRDPGALADALESLIALGAAGRRSLGERARRRVLEHFSIESVARRYEALYAALASKSRD